MSGERDDKQCYVPTQARSWEQRDMVLKRWILNSNKGGASYVPLNKLFSLPNSLVCPKDSDIDTWLSNAGRMEGEIQVKCPGQGKESAQ